MVSVLYKEHEYKVEELNYKKRGKLIRDGGELNRGFTVLSLENSDTSKYVTKFKCKSLPPRGMTIKVVQGPVFPQVKF